ncbi:MAG: ABC transporter permease subunit [Candidatus Aenigmatarchaeota archaeon]
MNSDKYKSFIYYIICICIFIVSWHIVASLYYSTWLPKPADVFNSFIFILTHEKTSKQIPVTIIRICAAVPIAMAIGCIIGILPRYIKPVDYAVKAVIFPLFQSVPPMVWVLLFAVWFGLEPVAPIIVTSMVGLPFVIIPISQGMKELDNSLIELGTSFTKKTRRIFRHIVLPLLYPYIFAAFRGSFGAIVRFIVVAEIFTTTSGIGYMMGVASELYNVSMIMAWTVFLGLFILIVEHGIFEYIENKIIKGKV